MHRRELLKAGLLLPWLPYAVERSNATGSHRPAMTAATDRVRPSDLDWPDADAWRRLHRQVGGRLQPLQSPFATDAPAAVRAEAMRQLHNPFYLGDQPALTQTSGWFQAWRSLPSTHAVTAAHTDDVVAAVHFARRHRLRLVVKGGGHSYQGTSNAPDSLLLWTRQLRQIQLHDAFVGQGCEGRQNAQPAVSLGAGCRWIDAYHAVTTQGGRYVQGGGCTTVGVAGLVLGGGFGSFSKAFGSAAGNLLEAEVVTADGQRRIANVCQNPELFWGLKGGGGGSLGIVTRLTLRTFALPATFGAMFGTIRCASEQAWRALVAELIHFYAQTLCNPSWGEQISLQPGNTLTIRMVFQGLEQTQAEAIWAPFIDWLGQRPEYVVEQPVRAITLPARHFWDAAFFRQHAPQFIAEDTRAGAPIEHMIWKGDQAQVGWFIHAYQSVWLPGQLLQHAQQSSLVDSLCEAARHWKVELHFNKGLFGASAEALAGARDTASHPQVLDAFALAIIAASGRPAYPGMERARIDTDQAQRDRLAVAAATAALRHQLPDAGAYLAESDYFQTDWQQAFWGSHYPRLAAVKRRYDPSGLFYVHHGVGSEHWSEDGFNRQQT